MNLTYGGIQGVNFIHGLFKYAFFNFVTFPFFFIFDTFKKISELSKTANYDWEGK